MIFQEEIFFIWFYLRTLLSLRFLKLFKYSHRHNMIYVGKQNYIRLHCIALHCIVRVCKNAHFSIYICSLSSYKLQLPCPSVCSFMDLGILQTTEWKKNFVRICPCLSIGTFRWAVMCRFSNWKNVVWGEVYGIF